MRQSDVRKTSSLKMMLVILCVLAAPVELSHAADSATPAVGPTAESALAAEQALTNAMRANDADGVGRWLADDWAVVTTHGTMGGDRAGFLEAIRTGVFNRKTMELSNPRVRLYGNTAVVTSRVAASGTFHGKDYTMLARLTDVFVWQDGGWRSVLTHETDIRQN